MEYIGRKFPINIKIQIALALFCFFGSSSILFIDGFSLLNLLIFIIVPCSLIFANVAIDLAYRVGWDGHCLAYRDWGLKSYLGNEIRIDVMDMTSLEGKYDGDTSMKRAFYEFDYINIRAKGLQGKKIWLHPMSLDELRLKLVLDDIYRLKPAIFNQNVIDYMKSDRDM